MTPRVRCSGCCRSAISSSSRRSANTSRRGRKVSMRRRAAARSTSVTRGFIGIEPFINGMAKALAVIDEREKEINAFNLVLADEAAQRENCREAAERREAAPAPIECVRDEALPGDGGLAMLDSGRDMHLVACRLQIRLQHVRHFRVILRHDDPGPHRGHTFRRGGSGGDRPHLRAPRPRRTRRRGAWPRSRRRGGRAGPRGRTRRPAGP